MIKKILKMTGISIILFLTILFIGGVLFVNISPEFGGNHSEEDIKRYEASGHYRDNKFHNLVTTNMDLSFKDFRSMLAEYFRGNPKGEPSFSLPVEKRDSLTIVENTEDQLIWFGHSTFLLQLDGKRILIDPMLGDTPSPISFMGPKRFSKTLPIEIEQLPSIDLVIISHDHYDHLDYGSIQKLKDKTQMFYVPLGVGAHLKEWGVSAEKYQEFNWWDSGEHAGIALTFTPSRHFSGRGMGNRFSTLWGSWVIKGLSKSLYFSGDSGYGDHFKEIGEKFGPFDFAMMECGQYNEKWANIHMMPEETAQASVDVEAKVMMPIHWGAFKLAFHDWNDPVLRVTKKAEELGVPVTIPKIGEVIRLNEQPGEVSDYWVVDF